MIQIRHVPEALHRRLKARGLSPACRYRTTCPRNSAGWPSGPLSRDCEPAWSVAQRRHRTYRRRRRSGPSVAGDRCRCIGDVGGAAAHVSRGGDGGTLLRSATNASRPHLLDLEVAQVLRRNAMTGLVHADRCRIGLSDLPDFPLHRYAHDFTLPRIWELRANLIACDAAYVALAEALDAPLLTRDERLAAARVGLITLW